DVATGLILIDDVGDITGLINSGDTTDDTQPTYSGKAESGSIVTVSDNGDVIGSAIAGADGSWAFTPDQPLDEGEHSFSSVVSDSAGNQSDVSDSIDFIVAIPEPVIISGSEDFDTVPEHVFDTVGDSLTLDNGMTITFVSGPTDGLGSNSFTEISSKGVYWFAPKEFGEQALMLVENSETHIDFNGLTNAVSFDVNASNFAGSVVNYYDVSGNLIHQQDLPVQTGDYDLNTISWVAPEGVEIASMSLVTTNGSGSNVITRVDNFHWGDDVTSTVSAEHQPIVESPAVDALDYSMVVDASLDTAAASQEHGSVDVHGHATLTVDQLLSEAMTDLFIADGKQQVAITGEEGSHVTLQSDASQWHENGQVTAGGVHYDVYQQQGDSLELLVQHGVELQHG
ncbi:MAG: Ig-like domain-containing protein, partial [Ewingella sp.]|nr:Ig-like domain-containing protein [Ewingella sp.]